MSSVSLLLLFLFFTPHLVMSNPCPTNDLLPLIEPIAPELLLNNIVTTAKLRDNQGEPLELSATQVILENGVISLVEPRLNGSPISSLEIYCTSFGTSLFGKEICLQSDTRGIDQALCHSLGLEPEGSQAFLTSSRESRKIFYFHENQWQEDSTRIPGNPNYQLQALLRFSCRL